ncbi:hypothetical protein ACP70R_011852 [Stipagrostis hirtigluma subsp. patula]
MGPILKIFLCCVGGLAVGAAAYGVRYQQRLAEERRQVLAACFDEMEALQHDEGRCKSNKASR